MDKQRNFAINNHELHELHEGENNRKIVHKELSYKIVAAALEVHNGLGPGFTENIYEEALCIELRSRGIVFERQIAINIFYKGEKAGQYRLDLVVENDIIVEIKAVSEMFERFEYQIYSYLKATSKKLGLLINFGRKSLDHKRIVN